MEENWDTNVPETPQVKKENCAGKRTFKVVWGIRLPQSFSFSLQSRPPRDKNILSFPDRRENPGGVF